MFPGEFTYAVFAIFAELSFAEGVATVVPAGSKTAAVRLAALPGIFPSIAEPGIVADAVKALVPLPNKYPLRVIAPEPP
jgi:hypothetical protein